MPTTKNSSHKWKIPSNLKKDVCVYFKGKNELGMCECRCEIKLNQEWEKNVSLPCDSKWKDFSFLMFLILHMEHK